MSRNSTHFQRLVFEGFGGSRRGSLKRLLHPLLRDLFFRPKKETRRRRKRKLSLTLPFDFPFSSSYGSLTGSLFGSLFCTTFPFLYNFLCTRMRLSSHSIHSQKILGEKSRSSFFESSPEVGLLLSLTVKRKSFTVECEGDHRTGVEGVQFRRRRCLDLLAHQRRWKRRVSLSGPRSFSELKKLARVVLNLLQRIYVSAGETSVSNRMK